MKTYVVNMTKDTEKRAQIESQLANHPELDYQIWRAVEGRKLSRQEQKQMVLPEFYERYGRNATLPAVGCSLSHINIYKDIIANNVKYALVLEDDAILSNDLKLDKISQLLNSDIPTAILMTPDFWYRPDEKVMDVDGKYKIYQLNDGYMTSGYAINQAAAKLLVPLIYPVKYTADAWGMFISFGLQLHGIVPHVISYPDGYGEIGMSQHVHKNTYEKIRAVAVYFYIRLLWAMSYLKGNRKSRKKWR